MPRLPLPVPPPSAPACQISSHRPALHCFLTRRAPLGHTMFLLNPKNEPCCAPIFPPTHPPRLCTWPRAHGVLSAAAAPCTILPWTCCHAIPVPDIPCALPLCPSFLARSSLLPLSFATGCFLHRSQPTQTSVNLMHRTRDGRYLQGCCQKGHFSRGKNLRPVGLAPPPTWRRRLRFAANAAHQRRFRLFQLNHKAVDLHFLRPVASVDSVVARAACRNSKSMA